MTTVAADHETDVWAALDHAVDLGASRPKLAADVEIARFRTRWGSGYTMVKNPRGPSYFRFTDEDGGILELLDGTRTVREIIVDRLRDSDELDVDSVVSLVELLLEGDFLEERWVDAYELINKQLASQANQMSRRLRKVLKEQTIRVNHVDELIAWIYRHGGRWLFSWRVNIPLLAIFLGGTVLFGLDVGVKHFTLSSNALATTFGFLFVFNILVTMVHELGHALGVKHAGRQILGAGFQLYLGSPTFFVESSDVMLATPKQRITQSWFGPYMDLIVSGGCAALAFAFSDSGSAQVLFNFAALGYLAALMNLIPFLELDGYWIVMDALHTTDLRPRSLAFLRHELPEKVRYRESLSRFEWVLLGFGVLGVLFTIAALVSSYLFWKPIFGAFVSKMWHGGVVAQLLLVLIGVIVLGPLMHALMALGRKVGQRLRFFARRVRFRTELGWRREAGEMLSRMPLLDDIPLDALNELAGRVTLRRVSAGEAVVRQGDTATEFFLVRHGRVNIVDETPDGEDDVLRSVSEGEAFGEVALLQSTQRTATARAESDCELFVVDKGSFDRLLADHVRVPDLAPSVSALNDVWSLPPFRKLSADDALRVAQAGEWVALHSDTEVITEGEAGDAFYVVAAGRLQVFEHGNLVRDLGPGDHFGEIALLLDVPRTATVRSRTPVRLFKLDRDAFKAVVARAFRSGAVRTIDLSDYEVNERA
jgi:putative peptide zinc metalloprotease protein